MLSQAASAQALEKTVITGFNSKLASRVAAFKANNTGVSEDESAIDIILTGRSRSKRGCGIPMRHSLLC